MVGSGGPERTWSLRREWSRAFTIMLVLLLVSAIAAIVGIRGLVGDVKGTARQLNRQSVAIAAVRTAVVNHEETAHELLSGKHVDRSAFLNDQQRISDLFAATVATFPVAGNLHATVLDARRSWQVGLTTYGLWGLQVQTLHGDHSVENPIYGASSDATISLLDGLEGPSLNAMERGLAHDDDVELILVVALLALFGLALAVTVYYRRRMARDLVRPVASMHQIVLKLQAGEYDHRIEISRRDELGELAEAFNVMAGALRENHLALTRRATHDSLTGLANRGSLTQRLAASFGPETERRAQTESVLFIDVDDFKDVNDSLGHEGGDALLVELAARLTECIRPYDLLGRLGGDEFAIVVVENDGDSAAVEIAERILDALREPFNVNSIHLSVSVSIGVAHRQPETTDAAELLRNADFAMYMAKGSGKGRYELFDARMHDNMVSRSALKTDLALAASSGELRLEYQPVADLRTGEVVGVEALVRWEHPTLGLLAPAEFIALAEETGDIDAIGCWVLDTATKQIAEWRRSMEHCADLWLSVNISAFQLRDAHNLGGLGRILATPAARSGPLVLEVTETALAAGADGGIAALNALKRPGVRIAIDDFGTGFSSLARLARLPVDILKIDRSFVSGQVSSTPSVPILEGILGLADKLSLTVIAEGIEEPEQLVLLRTLGCDLGQGYLLARPMPASDIEALLTSGGLLHVNVVTT